MSDNAPIPSPDQPSSGRLIRSTLIAAAVAIVLLFTTVLPAEYGVDPTGVGEMLGLTEMGRIKMSLAQEQAEADSVEAALLQEAGARDGVATPAPAPAPPAEAQNTAPGAEAGTVTNRHVTEVIIGPNEGKEVKLIMRKSAEVTFSWATDHGVVNYDLHGDAPGINYHGYGKGNGLPAHEGTLVAAFDGSHGWFWRNRGAETLTLTLRTSGAYQEVKRVN